MIGMAAVPEGALVVEAGGMGAPTVGAEKLDAYECEAALLGHSTGRMLPSGSSAFTFGRVRGFVAVLSLCDTEKVDNTAMASVRVVIFQCCVWHVRLPYTRGRLDNSAGHILCRPKCRRAVCGHELRDWGRERPGASGHWGAHGAAGRRCRLHGARLP